MVTAMTPWPPDIEAVVELHVHHDDFGPAAFAALPILLTHECVCHVPARQDRASNDSTFAEGLLDWVSDVFTSSGPESSTSSSLPPLAGTPTSCAPC